MSDVRFADKFLIKSNRLQNWDYTTPAFYFVTICTLNHNNFFGKIRNKKMVYSKMGLIVKQELLKTPVIRKNIDIPEWIIMPNHLHMILKIKYRLSSNGNISVGKSGDHNYNIETSNGDVETPRRDVSTNNPCVSTKNRDVLIKWKSNSLSSIINQFKSKCTKRINPKIIFFAWQPRFYDHIVQSKQEYYAIQQYIRDNIANWSKDPYHYK